VKKLIFVLFDGFLTFGLYVIDRLERMDEKKYRGHVQLDIYGNAVDVTVSVTVTPRPVVSEPVPVAAWFRTPAAAPPPSQSYVCAPVQVHRPEPVFCLPARPPRIHYVAETLSSFPSYPSYHCGSAGGEHHSDHNSGYSGNIPVSMLIGGGGITHLGSAVWGAGGFNGAGLGGDPRYRRHHPNFGGVVYRHHL